MGSPAEAEACPTAWTEWIFRHPNLKNHGLSNSWDDDIPHMGVSENVVYPCVPNGFADHYPYEKWLFHWEYTLFSDKPRYEMENKIHVPNHQPVSYEWRKGFTQVYDVIYENFPMTRIQNGTDFSDAMDFLTDIQKCRRRLAYEKN